MDSGEGRRRLCRLACRLELWMVAGSVVVVALLAGVAFFDDARWLVATQMAAPTWGIGSVVAVIYDASAAHMAVLDQVRCEPCSRVLEIGPGTGRVLPYLVARAGGPGFAHVAAIERAPAMCRALGALYGSWIDAGTLSVACRDVQLTPVPFEAQAAFDLVTWHGLLEHLEDPIEVLENIHALLAPHARIVSCGASDAARSTAVWWAKYLAQPHMDEAEHVAWFEDASYVVDGVLRSPDGLVTCVVAMPA